MYKNNKIIAIIPARGGSKRLPNKNILPLDGKRLIEWTIEATIKSKYIDTVVVSSDCDKILDIVQRFTNVIALKRPAEISSDDAKSIDVVVHTLDYFKNTKNIIFDYSIFLQPTSPFRDEYDIDNAIEYLFKQKADAVIGVTKMDHSPLWSNTLTQSNSMDNFLDENIINTRSQDLEEYYRINGAIYINNIKRLLNENRFIFSNNIYGYKMEQLKSIDIDTKFDLLFAETILKEKNE